MRENERKEDTRGCLMERRGSYGEEEILLADGCVAYFLRYFMFRLIEGLCVGSGRFGFWVFDA